MEKPREWLREKSIAKRILSEADVIFEVVDARIPFETRNKVIEDLASQKNKKVFVIINKADLVPEDFAEKAKKLIQKEYPAVLFSAHKNIGKKELERGEKLIKLSKNVYLIDTPGIITLEFQEDLALKGSWIPEKLKPLKK